MAKAAHTKEQIHAAKKRKNFHHLVKAAVTGFWVSAPQFCVSNS